jgi:aminopeptidase N
VWWDIVASLQKTYRHKNISTEDVLNLMNAKSGKNLKPYFDVYLRQGSLPIFTVELLEQNKSVLVKYNWSNVVDGFALPINIKLKGSEEIITLSPDKKEILIPGINKDQIEVDKSKAYFKLELK